MSIFFASERIFLGHHKILYDHVLDVRGIPTADWQVIAKDEERFFVLVELQPCGHRLRTRANQCIECRPAHIAFQRRNSEKGEVYIAASKSCRLYKVGSTSDYQQREPKLCADRYGGAEDWRIIAWAKVEMMGKVEFAVHTRLAKFEASGTYRKAGREVATGELFDTSLLIVWRAFLEETKLVAQGKRWKHPGFAMFDFTQKT